MRRNIRYRKLEQDTHMFPRYLTGIQLEEERVIFPLSQVFYHYILMCYAQNDESSNSREGRGPSLQFTFLLWRVQTKEGVKFDHKTSRLKRLRI